MNKANRLSGHTARNRNHAGTVILALLAVLFFSGGSSMGEAAETGKTGTAWFDSPEKAIPIITNLLKQQDFRTLSTYYDLSASGIDPATLLSGDFFIRKERPEMAHPGGFWRYKHPFAPGFRYIGMTADTVKDTYTIHLRIEIEQGEGAPPQIGLDTFRMIRSDKGWQILPELEKGKTADMPATAKPLSTSPRK